MTYPSQENRYCIYKHTCLINSKVYIGQTCQNPPEKRWRGGAGYRGTSHFYNAILKHGWDNFSHEILETNLSSSEANERECYWIKHYNSTNPLYGYNYQCGGSNAGYVHSETHNANTSKSLKSYYQTDEGKAFMRKKSESMKGTKNPNYGNHALQGIGSNRSKPVYCYELDRFFGSVREAARVLGIKSANGISQCCLGKYKKANGYTWRFATESEVKKLKEVSV